MSCRNHLGRWWRSLSSVLFLAASVSVLRAEMVDGREETTLWRLGPVETSGADALFSWNVSQTGTPAVAATFAQRSLRHGFYTYYVVNSEGRAWAMPFLLTANPPAPSDVPSGTAVVIGNDPSDPSKSGWGRLPSWSLNHPRYVAGRWRAELWAGKEGAFGTFISLQTFDVPQVNPEARLSVSLSNGGFGPYGSVFENKPYDVVWTTANAVSVVVKEDGVPIGSTLGGSVTFSAKPRRDVAYVYRIEATSVTGVTVAAEARMTVFPRNLGLRASPSAVPVVSLTPSSQVINPGERFALNPTVVDASVVSSSTLAGPGVNLADPGTAVSLTAPSPGTSTYSFTAVGSTLISRELIRPAPRKVELNTPSGPVDMTTALTRRVSEPGAYSLSVEDSAGNFLTSDLITVDAPASASASAQVVVRNPRIIAFSGGTIAYRESFSLSASSNGDGTPTYTLLSGSALLTGSLLQSAGTGLAQVQVSYPTTETYASGTAVATIRMEPKILSFIAESPPAPTVTLSATPTWPIVLGDSVALDIQAFNAGEVTLSGGGADRLNPPPFFTVTPTQSGAQLYRVRAAPKPTGRLQWVVEGAARVEIDGVPRYGGSWEAPTGRYRLRAVGGDEVDVWSHDVAIDVPPPAEASVTVGVRPRVIMFEVQPPPEPTASVSVSPTSGWVNPANVDVSWSTSQAVSVATSATGASSGWNSAAPAGNQRLVLGPGPHQFMVRAGAGPGQIRWQAAGAAQATLRFPDGRGEAVNPTLGALAVTESGSYQIELEAPDGLRTQSDPLIYTIPPDAVAQAEGIVDVTLTVDAGPGGTASGTRVVPFGQMATFQAKPDHGYHWTNWTGDFTGDATSGSLPMTADRRVTANFAPNRYLITAGVVPSGAGKVSGEGSYFFATQATLVAYPEKYYKFTRWEGAAAAVPTLTVPVSGDAGFVARFERIQYRLGVRMEGAGAGTVSPGSSMRMAGESVTVSATPDARSRLIAWGGDAGGAAPVVTIQMEGDREVSVRFEPKLAQTIAMPKPGDEEPGRSTPVAATSSSGLPVLIQVVSGPAVLNGGKLTITGLGPIVLRATQVGDDLYLPADPVEVALAGVPAPTVAFREAGAEVVIGNSKERVPNWKVGE